MGHAEQISITGVARAAEETYLLTHAVYKATSAITKVRAVFDASVKSSTRVSLNEILQWPHCSPSVN